MVSQNGRRRPLGVLTSGMLIVVVIFAGTYIGKKLLMGDGEPVHGTSMNHGLVRMSGILDDGDYTADSVISDPAELIPFVLARGVGYQVAGDFGDVISYWPYGAKFLPDGIHLDPTINTPQSVLDHPARIVHRVLVWVEFNVSTGNFDVPSMNLANVTNVTIPGVPYFDEFGSRTYKTKDLKISLVFRRDNVTAYPGGGRHSGFITKGDFNEFEDQGLAPIVKPSWIIGKVVRVVDRETIEFIDQILITAVIAQGALAVATTGLWWRWRRKT